MATILLSAAGAALGGALGGSVLGLSTAVIGRAVGAVAGRLIDERLLGSGSSGTSGQIDRFRLTGAGEGTPLGQVHGRMRVQGQIIWATRFLEQEGGGSGKGGSRRAEAEAYSYSVSLAVALCEAEITRIGRIWADGQEVSAEDLNMRVYLGTEDQQADPKIEAVEGAGLAPAYRGTAYIVFEDLPLGQFGNRVPQFNFEVFRPGPSAGAADDVARLVKAVALIPGTGEYSLATEPVYLSGGYGEQLPVNVSTPSGKTDFSTSLDALTGEISNLGSVSLVVSWFGDDLRCGQCEIRPKVEQADVDAPEMPWRSGAVDRNTAEIVPQSGGSPVYGGTPSDQSVLQAIAALKAEGKDVVYYPFILMDQLDGNELIDPYSGAVGQPALPWRGRITLSMAPSQPGSPDATAAADAEVDAFFGTASPGDFTVSGDVISYGGPAEWSFRRFVLHQAHLCAAAGGVDAFCIGSEMRGLTQIRGASGFPAVAHLQTLAADVRSVLGAGCKLGYAADWSEYHGYQPSGTGDKYFHLDPLWADSEIDFIGIDNYMPLSDWRDGEDHADVSWGSIYNLDYLTGNVAGGEGYDWYYHSDEARDAQIRTPITDLAEAEPWIWRYKDIQGWWSHLHHDRIGGIRQVAPSAWVPGMKPIWFTEMGCAAINKGTNQPNKFLDPKSSESSLPHYSNGLRDEFMQLQYIRAMTGYYAELDNNPVSLLYGQPMVDMQRAHVWAWDARPFPAFPAREDLWSDGENYARGHWLNGRSTSRPLSAVVTEICAKAGVTDVETDRLWGLVRGYRLDDSQTARAALQVLMLAYSFDVVERDGKLVFISRTGQPTATMSYDELAFDPEENATVETMRSSAAERAGRVRLGFIEGEGNYDAGAAEAVFADDPSQLVSSSELPLALTRSEARGVAERWLAEARIARDTLRFALPPSAGELGPGDTIILDGPASGRWRIDQIEDTGILRAEAVRIEPETYLAHDVAEETAQLRSFSAAVPVEAVFLDLPLMSGEEEPHAPHVAVTAKPWPGSAALYAAQGGASFALDRILARASNIGETLSALDQAPPGLYDRGPALVVRMVSGQLSSATPEALFSGANLVAIGSGADDVWELFQFEEALLIAPNTYELKMRLRGQAGSDAVMPAQWPVGSRLVIMNGVPEQISLAQADRGLARTYRWGPAQKPVDDAAYRQEERSFGGIGLRPYSVAHLRHVAQASGDVGVSWIRRTRIEGDPWSEGEVPLGETYERYALRVMQGAVVLREIELSTAAWIYSTADQTSDGVVGTYSIEVAQISDRFGNGPFIATQVN